jgi:hypothetical protein
MAGIPDWWMKGDWFDVCSCNLPCPCAFAQAPTNNHCEGVMAYHAREGAYGDVRLDGLNVIVVVVFDGNAWARENPVSIGILMDQRASNLQRDALQKIFSGQAGGWIGWACLQSSWAKSVASSLFRSSSQSLRISPIGARKYLIR